MDLSVNRLLNRFSKRKSHVLLVSQFSIKSYIAYFIHDLRYSKLHCHPTFCCLNIVICTAHRWVFPIPPSISCIVPNINLQLIPHFINPIRPVGLNEHTDVQPLQFYPQIVSTDGINADQYILWQFYWSLLLMGLITILCPNERCIFPYLMCPVGAGPLQYLFHNIN